MFEEVAALRVKFAEMLKFGGLHLGNTVNSLAPEPFLLDFSCSGHLFADFAGFFPFRNGEKLLVAKR